MDDRYMTTMTSNHPYHLDKWAYYASRYMAAKDLRMQYNIMMYLPLIEAIPYSSFYA